MAVVALRFRLLLAGIAGLSVLGCTGSPVIVDSTSSADYSLGLVAHGGRSGEMTVEIHGQPFAQVVSKQAIASTIPVPPWLGVRRLTTAPLPVTPRDYRVVLIFNPAERGGARDACVARQPSVVAPAGGELRVSAAYCAFDRSVAHLVARGPGGGGPDDPRFRAMMGQVLAQLLPASDPNMQGDGNCMNQDC